MLSETKSRVNAGNNKILLIIAIVVVVSLSYFVFFRPRNQTKPAPASSNQQPVDQAVDQPTSVPDSGSPSTSTTTIGGVLIGDGNPWKVIYDDPSTGSPAATLELVFTDSSRCDFGQGDTSCSPMYYEVGTGIEVTGQKDGSKLIVSHIKRAVSLMRQ